MLDTVSSTPSEEDIEMKLPKHQTDGDDLPFLSVNDTKGRHALDGLANASAQRSRGFGQQTRGNNSNTERINKYEPKPGIINKIRGIIMDRPVVRWALLILIVIGLFVFVSDYVFSPNSSGYNAEIKLDFTLENLISASIGLSKLAAEKIRQVKIDHKENTKTKGFTAEQVAEPVTVADGEANSVFINGFNTLFSNSRAIGNPDGTKKIDFTIISEETDPKKKEITPPSFEYISLTDIKGDVLLDPTEISIIVDPLDATKEYTEEYDNDDAHTYMLPYVTTLVCIVKKGEPIAGIVGRPYAPEGESQIIWAAVDEGKIHGAPAQEATGDAANTITISRSHTGDAGDIVTNYFPGKHALKVGGAGYKSYLVLTGQADAYIHSTAIKTWDLCAGHALLKAAGGDVTDKDGNHLEYKKDEPKFHNGLVAAFKKDKINQYVDVLSKIDFAAQQKKPQQVEQAEQQQNPQ